MAEHPAEHKEEHTAEGHANEEKKKPKGTLESMVDEAFRGIKGAVNLGIAAIAPATGYLLTGNAGVPVVSAAFVAGSGGNLTSKKIRNESLGGAIWGTFLNYFAATGKYISNLAAKVAYTATLPFIANTFIPTTSHLIENGSPKGLYEKLNKNYWTNVKKSFKIVWPIVLASTLFFTNPAYIVGSIGAGNFLYRKLVAGNQEEDKKGKKDTDKTTYTAAAKSVSHKLLGNTAKGLYEAVDAIGKTFGSYLTAPAKAAKSAAKAEAPVAPHGVPAHAT